MHPRPPNTRKIVMSPSMKYTRNFANPKSVLALAHRDIAIIVQKTKKQIVNAINIYLSSLNIFRVLINAHFIAIAQIIIIRNDTPYKMIPNTNRGVIWRFHAMIVTIVGSVKRMRHSMMDAMM